jgi:hypothetical protein
VKAPMAMMSGPRGVAMKSASTIAMQWFPSA